MLEIWFVRYLISSKHQSRKKTRGASQHYPTVPPRHSAAILHCEVTSANTRRRRGQSVWSANTRRRRGQSVWSANTRRRRGQSVWSDNTRRRRGQSVWSANTSYSTSNEQRVRSRETLLLKMTLIYDLTPCHWCKVLDVHRKNYLLQYKY